MLESMCRCGHTGRHHQHYRPGTDCSYGRCKCRRFNSDPRMLFIKRASVSAARQAQASLPGGSNPLADLADDLTRELLSISGVDPTSLTIAIDSAVEGYTVTMTVRKHNKEKL